MHKGEVVAVSPKGRGMHPNNFMVLLKNDKSEAWLPIDDAIDSRKIEIGLCEFELTDANTIKELMSESQKKQSTLKTTKTISKGHTTFLKELDIEKLSLEINKLNEKRKVAATQVFPLNSPGKPLYNALVYFRA